MGEVSKPKFTFDAAHKRALTTNDVERSRIGERIWGATLDQIPDSVKYKKKLTEYLDNLDKHFDAGTGLILTGPHGSGKSGSAVIVAKEVMARGCSALFMEEDSLVGAVLKQEEYKDGMTIYDRALECALLIVDDLGLSAESGNNHITETIIKRRVHRMMVTIITTNMKKEEYDRRYPTISSALMEAAIPIYCDGINWRDHLKDQIRGK